MSKVLAYYHIVFCTKERHLTLPLDQCEHLYRFIWRELTDNKCRLLRIGGVENHVHMLIELHPTIALSSLMQNIKSHSAGWLNKDSRFPDFAGWAKEYYAASVSHSQKEITIEYIKSQLQHHQHTSFDKEMQTICLTSGIAYDDRDLR